MGYIAKITNTRLSPLSLYYRAPGSDENRPLISVSIPSRALNYDWPFTDVAHFEAFKTQNASLIQRGVIILGTTKEKDAIKANETNAKEDVKNVRESKKKVTEAFEKSVTNQKTKLKLDVVKADD